MSVEDPGPLPVRLEAAVTARTGAFRLDATFTVRAGETAALIGPNGAGKTTLIRALSGLHPLETGRVAISGGTVEDTERGLRVPPQKRSVGVMFQGLVLFPNLSALENVAYGVRARGASRGEARERARSWLTRMAIGDLASRRPHELSGGEAARVALARALATTPAVLLLDEPLSALDARTRRTTRRLLVEVLSAFEGATLVVTHDPVDALTLGDRLLVLENGQVVQDGTADDVRRRPRSDYAASLIGVNLFRGELRSGGEGAVVHGDWGELVVARPRSGEAEPASGPVLLTFSPRAVAVALEKPTGSARNVLEGDIVSVDVDADRARLTIATGPPVTAEVTAATLERMRLEPGRRVWATVKATEIDVDPA